jgi:replicative DNA helicase
MADRKQDWVDRRIQGLTDEELIRHDAAIHRRIADKIGQTEAEAEERSELASIAEYLEAAQEFEANWGKMQGISSGYRSIDALTKGFVLGELVILGGYTSRGKTQLAVNMAHRIAHQGTPVLFVTLEMTKPMLTSRFARLGGIAVETPIFYQRIDAIEPADLDRMIERAKGDGCGFVVVDHLHYFARGENILGQVGKVTRDFKRLAVKHEVPILLLSQLSRPEKTGQKKLKVPSLSDLKESSYIEQDADVVLMVHRNLPDDDPDADVDSSQVIVAQRKNRNRGMTGGQLAYLRHDQANGVLLTEAPAMFPSKK